MKHLLLLLAVFVGWTTKAQDSFSLSDAVSYGVKNSSQSKLASYDLDIAQKKVRETVSLGLPQLSAELNYQNFIDIPVQVAPGAAFGIPDQEFVELQFGTEHNASFKFTVSQLILDGSYIIGLKAASSFVHLAELQKNYSEQQVKQNIRSAYYMTVLADENIKSLKESYTQLEKIFSESKALFQNGFIDQSNLDQLEISLLNLENGLKNAENQKETSMMLLKLHMGFPQENDLVLTDGLDQLIQTSTIGEFKSEDNLQYDLLNQQLVLQELNVQRKQMQRMPSLFAFYNHQQNAYRNDFSFFDADQSWYPTNLIGISLSIPVFDSGGQQSRINQAKVEVAKVEEQKILLDQQLKLQYAQASNNLINAENQMKLSKRKRELSAKILKEARVKFQEGMISSFDLNQTEQQFIQENGNYLQAVMMYLTAKNEMNQLLNQ